MKPSKYTGYMKEECNWTQQLHLVLKSMMPKYIITRPLVRELLRFSKRFFEEDDRYVIGTKLHCCHTGYSFTSSLITASVETPTLST